MIKLRLFWLLAILCVSIIGSFIFFFGFDYSSKNSSVKKTLQQKPKVPVELGLVREMEIKEKLSLTGEFKANESVFVRPEVAGKIISINFTDGKRVKKGDKLLELDSEIPLAEFLQAEAEFILAEQNFLRAKTLNEKDFLSTGSLEDTRAALGVAGAKKMLTEAKLKLFTVKSPFNGVIGLKNVSIGDFIEVGENILLLEDLKTLKFDFKVPERYVNYLVVGEEIKIFTEVRNIPIVAKIDVLDIRVDQDGRYLTVRSFVKNFDHLLRSGMFGKVEIVLKKRARGIVIPEEAVFSEQSRKYVWKVINAKVEKILIKTGVRLEKHIEVTDGLKVGDSVVTKGQLKLRKTGQLVKVLQ